MKKKIIIGVILLAIAGIGVGVFIKEKYFREEFPIVHPCRNKLRQIGAACSMYAYENQGKFAPELADYSPNYVVDPRLFFCPGYVDERSGWGCRKTPSIETHKYIYLPNIPVKDKENSIMVFCPTGHNNWRYVVIGNVYVDGYDKGMPDKEFNETLKELLAQEDIDKKLSAEQIALLKQIIEETKPKQAKESE